MKRRQGIRERKQRRVSGTHEETQVQTEKIRRGLSLLAQWQRIRLPMQRTQLASLTPEDPANCGAAPPVTHKHRGLSLEQEKLLRREARAQQLEEPLLSTPGADVQQGRACAPHRRPRAAESRCVY